MAVKDGIIGDVLMWSFLGAAGVLLATHVSSFDAAFNTGIAPIEYETSLIATAGSSAVNTKKS
jgi:hypothetical protein